MRKWTRFAVYQIKKDAPDREDKVFKPYAWIKTKFNKVNINDYCCVYFGECKVDGLDDIFTLCNTYPLPAGYSGHSLSVSDVVMVDGKLWYCDVIGWKEV